ncbi:amino acid adenylation domain-containing protein [Neorhizobium huautlense]|uniref:Amino acid adenylation domain-containing protein n=1 Tax=Neorhizobium huautlense TaxID=67774 RepID=A0ABT9PW89_9HYPH|nr:non-ribosomal peptide synthetase/type I polyketide synthase [Neorhizobium huautlense]MDP9838383.1 amino acid adenylation domain-containing protein [Neorhizobium huautlense]
MDIASIVDVLTRRAATEGERTAFEFWPDGNISAQPDSLSYAALDLRARSVATRLRASLGHDASNMRAILLFPAGLDFHAAFYGCLYAGVTAVPMAIPHVRPHNRDRSERSLERTRRILVRAAPSIVLTTSAVFERLAMIRSHSGEWRDLPWLTVDDLPRDDANDWYVPDLRDDTLAYLQFTSGSTGEPKAAMVSHANLIHQWHGHRAAFPVTSDMRSVVWLPHSHDWGLTDGVIAPVLNGNPCQLLPAASFLQRPFSWLKAISGVSPVISGAPNFAYDLCVRRIDQGETPDLDLSGWKIAQVGAETVRPATLEAFAQRFSRHGFSYGSFAPAYGMAETVLVATGCYEATRPIRQDADRTILAAGRFQATDPADIRKTAISSCGMPVPSMQLLIVDPDTLSPLADEEIGEVWLKGPGVALGYFNDPDLTRATFHAHTAAGDGPYLKTADLGFRLNGHLYVTGRIKDLIIVAGQNHYPQDIETSVIGAHPCLQTSRCAAFSIDDQGDEQLIIAIENTRAADMVAISDIASSVVAAIADEHGLTVEKLVFVKSRSLPMTTSGKIERRACRDAFLSASLAETNRWDRTPVATSAKPQPVSQTWPLNEWLRREIADRTGLVAEQIADHIAFADCGLNSRASLEIIGRLEAKLGRQLPATLLYDHPTIRTLVAALENVPPSMTKDSPGSAPIPRAAQEHAPIAIIGMACRVPGADSPEAFWKLCLSRETAIGDIPRDRFDVAPLLRPDGIYTDRGAFIEGIDGFDAGLFGISGREACAMDPQQRLLLETSWQALEDAGIAVDTREATRTAVFVGLSNSDYRLLHKKQDGLDAWSGTGNAASVAAGRISYALGFRGPCMTVDTACSSSLVATHLAMRAIRQGEADTALVGGVNLMLAADTYLDFCKTGMLSRGGHCLPFAEGADGYVRGEGCIVIVLKELARAQADHDRIIGVLHGSAVNHDGRSNGLTAPSRQAQADVIKQALADANTLPDEIDYVEAHGTGTKLGDPIELAALADVFGGRSGKVSVGSVKAQIGHLEAAAGLAGLMKTVLALNHRTLPHHLTADRPSPLHDWSLSPLALPSTATAWVPGQRAGVSSFGISGTNAHVIVGTAPGVTHDLDRTETGKLSGDFLLPLSAADTGALTELVDRYRQQLHTASLQEVADICFSAATARSTLPCRLALSGRDGSELAKRLSARRPGNAHSMAASRPVFLFPGQGAQYVGMARDACALGAAASATLEEGETIARSHGIPSLRAIMDGEDVERRLDDTIWTQPALFLIEVAIARQWQSFGLQPEFCIGHSIGELSAACVAGGLYFADGLRFAIERGRIMQEDVKPGSMAAILAGIAEAAAIINGLDALEIAARNGPRNIVIAGPHDGITEALSRANIRGVDARLLPVSRAFHTSAMSSAATSIADFAENLKAAALGTAMITTHDVVMLPPGASIPSEYWGRQARGTVDFQAAISSLTTASRSGEDFWLIEMGPGSSLVSNAATEHPPFEERCLASLQKTGSPARTALKSFARLWEAGAPLNCAAVQDGSRVPLPGYPFQKKRYWLDGMETSLAAISSQTPAEPATTPEALSLAGFDEPGAISYLRLAISQILLLDGAELDLHRPLLTYGMDSLMAIRMANRIRSETGISIPLAGLLGGGSIASITAILLDAPSGRLQSHASAQPAAGVAGERSLPQESRGYPLSSSQRRLWMQQQMHPDSPAYNLPTAIELSGPVDRQLLDQCLRRLQHHHPVLRTHIVDHAAEPMLTVQPVIAGLMYIDISDLGPDMRQQTLNRLLQGEAAYRFDLSSEAAFRALLIKLGDDRYVLALTFHHMVADGWSLGGIVIPELEAWYSALAAGDPLPEMAKRGTYIADPAAEGGASETDLAYWQANLVDLPPPTCLPSERRRPPTRRMQGRRLAYQTRSVSVSGLHATATRHGATLFMTMLSGLTASLHQFTGQTDVTIGTVLSTRTSDTESTLGDFTNFIPLRTRIDPTSSIDDLIAEVRRQSLDAFEHGRCPFDQIVAASGSRREGSEAPLFSVSFVLHAFDGRTRRMQFSADLTGNFLKPFIQIDNGTSEADLIIEAAEHGEALVFECEFDTDLYDDADILTFMQRYEAILSRLADQQENGAPTSDTSLACLFRATDMEAGKAIAFGRMDLVSGSSETLFSRFEKIAENAPTAIALREYRSASDIRSVTYGELLSRAKELAGALGNIGVGHGDLVGIDIGRSTACIVAMLAILHEGAAYVPMDEEWPEQRKAQLAADAKLVALVCDSAAATKPGQISLPLLVLDDHGRPGELAAERPPRQQRSGIFSSTTAYVIYTSGSTGTPKGVAISHDSVLRLVDMSGSEFGFSDQDVGLLFHSPAFDFSVWEIWTALLNGGRLIIPAAPMIRDPKAVQDILRNERVTVFNQTPTAFRSFTAHHLSAGDLLPSLRLIVFGGEALDPAVLTDWFAAYGDSGPRLVNMYGITETTVHVTAKTMTQADLSLRNPIGRPLHDRSVILLDDAGLPVPVGVPGEIHVGGGGVASGYIDRPALTAERFVPDPYSGQPGARLYRSGDAARWLADGSLEYIARLDVQLKIRGYRIEPAEIGAVLKQHSAVEDCIVIPSPAGDTQGLIAYVVARTGDNGDGGDAATIAEWRDVFDATYAAPADTAAPNALNSSGWNRSHDGSPIPQHEMREWVDHTVSAIEALQPRRILEIGCGTGMLLLRLAPTVERYIAMDISAVGLAHIADKLSAMGDLIDRIDLVEGAADALDDIAEGSVDTIVMNSVTQLFPSIDYLERVITKALTKLTADGAMFVGDVRNHAVQEAFHLSVLAHDDPDTIASFDQSTLTALVAERCAEDKELTIGPEYFRSLPRRHPALSRVAVHLKRTHADNEMTRFRFDAVLYRQRQTLPVSPPDWHFAQGLISDVDDIGEWLSSRPSSEICGLRGITNSRISVWAGALNAVPAEIDMAGIDPVALSETAALHGFRANLQWTEGHANGMFDALFVPQTHGSRPAAEAAMFIEPSRLSENWRRFAGNPQQHRQRTALAETLRQHVAQRLPAHMVPDAVIVIDALPITGNGKLDIGALPLPRSVIRVAEIKPPRDALDQLIVDAWSDVLSKRRIGIEDNFFALGGHSLKAVQLANRLRDALSIDVPLRWIFEAPTIAGQHDLILQELYEIAQQEAPPASAAGRRS